MPTLVWIGSARRSRSASTNQTLGLDGLCPERPEVNQNKPKTIPLLSGCRHPPLRSCDPSSWTCRLLRRHPGLFPLYDVIESRSGALALGRNTALIQYGCSSSTLPTTGGARRDRTDDLKLAKLALSQLSYGPDTSESAAREGALGSIVPASTSLSGGPGKI